MMKPKLISVEEQIEAIDQAIADGGIIYSIRTAVPFAFDSPPNSGNAKILFIDPQGNEVIWHCGLEAAHYAASLMRATIA